jgi:hypothetical protein
MLVVVSVELFQIRPWLSACSTVVISSANTCFYTAVDQWPRLPLQTCVPPYRIADRTSPLLCACMLLRLLANIASLCLHATQAIIHAVRNERSMVVKKAYAQAAGLVGLFPVPVQAHKHDMEAC